MRPRRSVGVLLFRWLQMALVAACILPNVVHGQTPGAYADPPAPDPVAPVKYLKWINSSCRAESGNAADDYRKALAGISPFKGDWGETLDGPWSDNPAVSEWLATNQEALRLFAEATTREIYCSRFEPPRATGDARVDGLLMAMQLPPLGPFRTAAKGLIAESYREWERGDRSRLTKNALAALRSSNHLMGGFTLIERLVGTAIRAAAYDAILRSLDLSHEPDSVASALVSELANSDTPIPPFATIVDRERLSVIDFCQRVFIPGEDRGSWQVYKPVLRALQTAANRKLSSTRIAKIGYRRTVNEVNAYFDAAVEWSRQPYHVIAARGDRRGGESDSLGQMVQGSKNPLVQALAPSLTAVRELNERITATRRATLLVVHILHHHQRNKRFPRKLDDLDVPNLAELRIDPFSGKDFVYKRRRRAGFMLYSVGSNLTDDGGKHDHLWKSGDYVFWPVQD